MPGRAAVYARISSDKEGRENGVARQRDLCADLARRRGLDVLQVFVDNDISASRRSTKARPQYAAMLAAAERGEVDAIIAYSNSRLTRRPREFEDLIDLVEKRGTRIYTIASGRIDLATADGQMLARILAASDTAEADRASERVKAAVDQRRQQGKYHGGNLPYGYRTEDGRLVLHEREASLLREAAEKLLAGDTMYGIVKTWNDKGVRTGRESTKPRADGQMSPQHWRQANLRAKLLNLAVTGVNKLGVEVAEPVLDQRTFERVRDLLTDPARNAAHSPGVKSAKYTMAGGLTTCGECGHRMYGLRHRDKTVLACLKHASGPGACGRNRIDHDLTERYVFDVVLDSLRANSRWADELRRSAGDDSEATALRQQRERLADQARRLNELYVLGDIERRQHAEQSQRIKDETERVTERLRRVDGPRVVDPDEVAGLTWDRWVSDWSVARRRGFLRQALSKVEVLRDAEVFKTLKRRGDETERAFEQRRDDYVNEVLGRRVRLTV